MPSFPLPDEALARSNVPLGIQSYERADGFQPETRLINLIIEKDEAGLSPDGVLRLQRPGLSALTTVPGNRVRGLYYQAGIAGGLPVVVCGATAYTTDGANNTSIGTVGDDGLNVDIAGAYDQLGIISDGLFYVYDGTTLSNIAIPDDKIAVALASIDSYIIIAIDDGTFYWLVPGETTINALNFATAEFSPDGLVGVRTLGDDIFFFGNSTIEVWQTTGTADAPFQRAPGRLYDKGCLARDTIVSYDNSLVWVGDDGIVYRADSVPQRISNFGIEERLRKRTDEPSAFVMLHNAHLFYVLRIPGQGTFAFDASTKAWSEFSTQGETLWKPHVATQTPSGTYLGDATTGKLWLLDPDSNTDDGTPIERLVSGSIPLNGRPTRNDNFTLFTGSSEDCEFQVRWFDGRETPGEWTTLTVRSPVDNASIFRLGTASQPVRTYEVRCVADAKVRISGALINQAWKSLSNG